MKALLQNKKAIRVLILSVTSILLALVIVAGIFLASADGSAIYEDIAPVRTYKYANTGWTPKVKDPNHIKDVMMIGSWSTGYKTDIYATIDQVDATFWNPLVNVGFTGNPGAIYLFDGVYSVDSFTVFFTKRAMFFDLYSSIDGENFSLVKQVTANNMSACYTIDNERYICSLEKLNIPKTAFLKIVFTGTSEVTSRYIAMHEVSFTGTLLGEGPDKIPESNKEKPLPETLISSAKPIGSWIRDRLDVASLGPACSYDGNIYSYWNPQANPGYAEDPGIIYTLKTATNIKKLEFYFVNAEHYFDVFVSSDGKAYQQIAAITMYNAENGYTKPDKTIYLCTLDGLNCQNTRYVKLVFTGRPQGNTYVGLTETIVSTDGKSGISTKWMMQGGKNYLDGEQSIASFEVIGSWVRDRMDEKSYSPNLSYDGNDSTFWNPQAKGGYAGEPGILYTLSKPANVKKISLSFVNAEHYFDLYVSSDGKTYNKIAKINENNAEKAYTSNGKQYLCTLDGLDLQSVCFVKLIFTGRPKGNTYVGLSEISINEKGKSGQDNAWMLQSNNSGADKGYIPVVSHQVIGSWVRDRVNESTYTPNLSYDGNDSTFWNPQAKGGYTEEPGIIYSFGKAENLGRITLSFINAEHYFDAFVSSDGETYTKIAQISNDNAPNAYTASSGKNYICVLDGLNLQNIKYCKIVFTGRPAGNTYVGLNEITFSSNGTKGLDISWMLPQIQQPTEEPNEEQVAVITAGEITGVWVNAREADSTIGPEKSYDGELSTKWNPQASGGYQNGEGIIYTLYKAYNLSSATLIFGNRTYAFDLYVSSDGVSFVKSASVTAENANQYYENYVCRLSELSLNDVHFVKFIFTGSSDNNTYLNLFEVKLYGTPADEIVSAKITGHSLSGSWILGREGDGKIGPHLTYDGKTETYWNPQATNYKSDEAIVYTLDGTYDINTAMLTFGKRKYYFDLYTSKDGEGFIKIASVTAENAASYYTGYVCTLPDLNGTDSKYIKVIFTGNEGAVNTFISLYEIAVSGKLNGSSAGENTTSDKPAKVVAHKLTGSWLLGREGDSKIGPHLTYDGKTETYWNPQATNYKSDEAIVYTFDTTYDINTAVLTFGKRKYYFDLYTSKDGEGFIKIASVTSENAANYYSEYVCTLTELNAADSKYVKVVFTGNEGAVNTFVSLYEAVFSK